MAYEMSFLEFLMRRSKDPNPITEEQILKLENIIDQLINVQTSKSRRFVQYTRLEHLNRLLKFLKIICKKSSSTGYYDLLYKSAKKFAKEVYKTDNVSVIGINNNAVQFLTIYMMLIEISLDRCVLLDENNIQKKDVVGIIQELINYADSHIKSLYGKKELITKYQKLKNNVLTKCYLR